MSFRRPWLFSPNLTGLVRGFGALGLLIRIVNDLGKGAGVLHAILGPGQLNDVFQKILALRRRHVGSKLHFHKSHCVFSSGRARTHALETSMSLSTTWARALGGRVNAPPSSTVRVMSQIERCRRFSA